MGYRLVHRLSADSSSFSYTPVCTFLTFVKVILCLSLLVHSFCLLPFSKTIDGLNTKALRFFLLFAVIRACFCMWDISLFFQHALSHTKDGMNQATGVSKRNILSNRSCSIWLEKGFSYLRISFQGMLSMFQRMIVYEVKAVMKAGVLYPSDFDNHKDVWIWGVIPHQMITEG